MIFEGNTKVYIYLEAVDMRNAIEGLTCLFFCLIRLSRRYLRYLLEKMTFMKSLDKEFLIPLMPQNTDDSVIEEFRRNNSNQNIEFTSPLRFIYENGIFKQVNQ